MCKRFKQFAAVQRAPQKDGSRELFSVVTALRLPSACQARGVSSGWTG